jgi:hypothetical protein
MRKQFAMTILEGKWLPAKWWWLLLPVVLLAAPLVWLLRGFARDIVLGYVQRLVWSLHVLLESLPQAPIWLLFVLIVLYIAYRSLFARTRFSLAERRTLPDAGGRVRRLATRIERADRGDYYRWDLARHLGSVVVHVLAHEHRTNPATVRQRLRAGDLDIPDEIREFLFAGLAPIYTLAEGAPVRGRYALTAVLSRALRSLGVGSRSLLPPTGRSEASGDGLDAPALDDWDLDHVVHFLEDRLEVPHVRR